MTNRIPLSKYETDNQPEQPEPEERRCDLCKYVKDAPCPGKGCNSVNNLKDFKPMGSEEEDTRCSNCDHWAAVRIGDFCPDCGQKL